MTNVDNDNESYVGIDLENESDIGDQHENYKGIYFQENNNEQQYFEAGAHFSYKEICGKLENLICVLSPDRKGKSIYEDEFSSHGGSSVAKTKPDSGKITVGNHKVSELICYLWLL